MRLTEHAKQRAAERIAECGSFICQFVLMRLDACLRLPTYEKNGEAVQICLDFEHNVGYIVEPDAGVVITVLEAHMFQYDRQACGGATSIADVAEMLQEAIHLRDMYRPVFDHFAQANADEHQYLTERLQTACESERQGYLSRRAELKRQRRKRKHNMRVLDAKCNLLTKSLAALMFRERQVTTNDARTVRS